MVGKPRSKDFCPLCKHLEDKDIKLEKKHDTTYCPNCNTSWIDKNESPLPRYQEQWINESEKMFPLIRPPIYQQELANPRLYWLYEDCYFALLIGRPNMSIVMMGVLLEAIMKEIILLKLGKEHKEAYGSCLNIIKDNKLMKVNDIQFLEEFKDEIRNPYVHSDEEKILQDMFIRVWAFEFDKDKMSPELLKEMKEGAETGKYHPIFVPIARFPEMRTIVKDKHDRERAIELFNQVSDFLIESKIKYFKPEEYKEHMEKYGSKLEKIKRHRI